MEEEKITITIKKRNWKTFKQLQLEKDLKTHDEVIEYLLKQKKIKRTKKVTHLREITK